MEGVSKAADVFACYGVEECCGKCVPEIEECLEKSNQQTTFQNAAPKVINFTNTRSI
jgi:bacterioferritin-associated ferredoxin